MMWHDHNCDCAMCFETNYPTRPPAEGINVWKLRCLLCGNTTSNNLVTMQEHAIEEHGITRDDLRYQDRAVAPSNPQHFIYILPDGRAWLDALKTE